MIRLTMRRPERTELGGCEMGWFIGGGILYVVLLITMGVMTLRKGHVVLFVVGLFLPFVWLLGAIMPPAERR
jgi:hypothetical protein